MLLPFLLRATISLIVTDYIVLARPHLEVEKPRGVASIEVVQECVMTSKSTGSAIFHLRHPGDIIEADHTDKAIEITSLRCGAEYKFGGINSNINEDGEMCQLVNFNDDAAEAFNFQIRDCIPTVKDVLNTSPTKRSLEDGFDRCKDGVEQLATRLGVMESKRFKSARKNGALIKKLCSIKSGDTLPEPAARRPSVDSDDRCLPADFCPSSPPALFCCGLICTGIVVGVGVAAVGR